MPSVTLYTNCGCFNVDGDLDPITQAFINNMENCKNYFSGCEAEAYNALVLSLKKIVFAEDSSAFPETGVSDTLYVDKANLVLYIWSIDSYLAFSSGTGSISYVNNQSDLPVTGQNNFLYVIKTGFKQAIWNGSTYDITSQFTAAEKTKLTGIQAEATKNSSDAQLNAYADDAANLALQISTEFTNTTMGGHITAPDPHPQYQKESEKNQANGYAGLDSNSQINPSQIPAIAISEYLDAVSNQSQMLALVGQKGDWCTRTDLGTNWIITGNDPTQLSSWTQLSYPTSPVISVNGNTGVVVLGYSDVGADQSGAAASAISTHVAASNPHNQYLQTDDYSVDIAASDVIPFNRPVSNMADQTITGTIVLTENLTGAKNGYYTQRRLIGSGSGTVDTSAFKKFSNSMDIDTSLDAVNVCMFIRISDVSYMTNQVEAAPPPESADIVFNGVTNIIESPADSWIASGGSSGYGNTGIDTNNSMGDSVNAVVYCSGNSHHAVLGFNSANAQVGFANMEAGLVIAGGVIYPVDNGVLGSSIGSISTSNDYGVRRVGSAFDIAFSSDGGVTWTSLGTLTYSSTAQHWVVTDIQGSSEPGILVTPKISYL